MNIFEAMENRHSVRNYKETSIDRKLISALENEIRECNEESGLNIQLITNDSDTFSNLMARYGHFSGVSAYLALVGKRDEKVEEKAGYYGERLVLAAQMMGLNTCWVGLTYSKGKCRAVVNPKEKLICLITIGYGKNSGKPHKSKNLESLCSSSPAGYLPDWFKRGMKGALLAPTAVNQQKFKITLKDKNKVHAQSTGGFYSKIDLGIVKYHFEKAAGKENFTWE